MTKQAMVADIAADLDLPKAVVERVVNAWMLAVQDELVHDGRVELRRFGTFKAVERPAYTGTHPQTGEPLPIPAARRVRFTASAALKKALNPSSD